MRAFKSTRFAIATFKDPFIVLSCLSNPYNSLSGNNLSLSLGSMKDVSCSTPLTVVSIALEVISIISIASVSVVDEDFISFDLSLKFSFNFLTFSLVSLYLAL